VRRWLFENSLSIAFLVLFLGCADSSWMEVDVDELRVVVDDRVRVRQLRANLLTSLTDYGACST
jgi:hypothetical protein